MRAIALLVSLLLTAPLFAGGGRVLIINRDAANTGFNDPTPVEPVGGNPATTLGAQRLYVFEAAAAHWTKLLNLTVDVRVVASFAPIAGCTATEAILGQAAPLAWRHSFAKAPKASVWYPIALANQLSGVDQETGLDDINARFNADLDKPTCFGDSSWYYGLDNEHGNNVNLYNVVLHELAHGLGFAGALGAPDFRQNLPSVFDTQILDTTLGTRWDQMGYSQRSVSMTNTGNLVWAGEQTRTAAQRHLASTPVLGVSGSPELNDLDVGVAAFGPSVQNKPMTGRVVAAQDASDAEGTATNDGCSAFTNAAAVKNNIAYIKRGNCTFVAKVLNAQAAGATGVIVGDNTATRCVPPAMGGTSDEVTIPVLSISINAAGTLENLLTAGTPITVASRIDATRRAGASAQGFIRLYAPCTAEPGSSVYHFDTTASPNLLMEPSINGDLIQDVDLTLHLLLDMGWPLRSGRKALRR